MNSRKLLMIGMLAALLSGCVRDSWTYQAVPDINIARPNQLDSQGVLVLKTRPEANSALPESVKQYLKQTDPNFASRHTILVASYHHDAASYNTTMGRTLVIFLDGQPQVGQYWLNPDNAVLLSYSAYSAPARERVGLQGSIKIDEVNGNKIVAEVAVRDTTEIDSSNFLDRPFDPLNRAWPFRFWGKHTFAVTDPNDPTFDRSAVKFVNQ